MKCPTCSEKNLKDAHWVFGQCDECGEQKLVNDNGLSGIEELLGIKL